MSDLMVWCLAGWVMAFISLAGWAMTAVGAARQQLDLNLKIADLREKLADARRLAHPSSRPLRSVPSEPVLRSGGEWER